MLRWWMWSSWWRLSWKQSDPGSAAPSDWVVLSRCVCRTCLDVPLSLIGSAGKGTWLGAESQSWDAELLGGERWTSSLSPNTDTGTQKHTDAGQYVTHSAVVQLLFLDAVNPYLQERVSLWCPRWWRSPHQWPHPLKTSVWRRVRHGEGVLKGM